MISMSFLVTIRINYISGCFQKWDNKIHPNINGIFYNGEKYLNDKTIEKYFDRPFFRVMPTVDCEIEDCEPIGESKKKYNDII